MNIGRCFRRFWKRWQYLRGWRRCPVCRGWHKIKRDQEIVVFKDEPPMFFRYTCTGCGFDYGVWSRVVSDHVLKLMGYRDFLHYAKAVIEEESKRDKSPPSCKDGPGAL